MVDECLLTVCIPAFHAKPYIEDCLHSIMMQSCKKFRVIVASDSPDEDYTYLKGKFPSMLLDCLSTDMNTGPGATRQRALSKVTTPWVTFIDADDVFCNPYTFEILLGKIAQKELVLVAAAHVVDTASHERTSIDKNVWSPWLCGKIFNVSFLRENKIEFSPIRYYEDTEFIQKVKLCVEATSSEVKFLDDPVVFWRNINSSSITRAVSSEGVSLHRIVADLIGEINYFISIVQFADQRHIHHPSGLSLSVDGMMKCYIYWSHYALKSQNFLRELTFILAIKYYHTVYASVQSSVGDGVLGRSFQRCFQGPRTEQVYPKVTFNSFLHMLEKEVYTEERYQAVLATAPTELAELLRQKGLF